MLGVTLSKRGEGEFAYSERLALSDDLHSGFMRDARHRLRQYRAHSVRQQGHVLSRKGSTAAQAAAQWQMASWTSRHCCGTRHNQCSRNAAAFSQATKPPVRAAAVRCCGHNAGSHHA